MISSANYETETFSFDFTNQEIITFNVYVINSSEPNLGVIFIKPVDRFSKPIAGATVRALQWDPSSSTYIQVSESTTGSDGIGALNVILNDKYYIFTATFEGDVGTQEEGIIDTTENGETITITVTGAAVEYAYLLENVFTAVTETFNNVTNVSTVNFLWSDNNGISQTICINSYRVIGNTESLLTENCTTGVSGLYSLNFNINSSYQTNLKGIIKIGTNEHVIETFKHYPDDHPSELFKDIGLSVFIVPLLVLVAIGIGMVMENVYIGTFAIVILGGVSLALAPDILTKGIVAFFFFVGWLTIFYGVKPR